MKTIHKFQLKREGEQIIELPTGSQVLCFKMQDDTPTIWALVDTEKEEIVERVFHVYGTGHPIKDVKLKYIDTVFDGIYVWHLFVEL